jgi:hypothetical protein
MLASTALAKKVGNCDPKLDAEGQPLFSILSLTSDQGEPLSGFFS